MNQKFRRFFVFSCMAILALSLTVPVVHIRYCLRTNHQILAFIEVVICTVGVRLSDGHRSAVVSPGSAATGRES